MEEEACSASMMPFAPPQIQDPLVKGLRYAQWMQERFLSPDVQVRLPAASAYLFPAFYGTNEKDWENFGGQRLAPVQSKSLEEVLAKQAGALAGTPLNPEMWMAQSREAIKENGKLKRSTQENRRSESANKLTESIAERRRSSSHFMMTDAENEKTLESSSGDANVAFLNFGLPGGLLAGKTLPSATF